MCCAIDNTVTVSTSHARRIGYQLDQHSKDVHMLQAHSNVQLKKKKPDIYRVLPREFTFSRQIMWMPMVRLYKSKTRSMAIYQSL